MISLSRETNELPRKVQRVSSQDVNTQCRTGLPPISVATARNERGTTRQLQSGREKGGGRGNLGGRAQRPAIYSPVNLIPAVLNTLALVASRNARRRTNATCWFLPSTFTADILRGIVWDDVHHIYQCFWMPETTALEHVFVPIWDVDEAWYIMILDLRKPRVYSPDVHRTVENMARKEKQMKAVLRALSLMFATPTHILNCTDRSPDASGWGRILQAPGIPEDLTSSCLKHGDEDTLRMRLASSIVGAQCNELRLPVDEASQATWQAFVRAKLLL
ncbi:hypothetical protein PIB30_026836 [Stylosanthes scabra]|uniref:Uncharacterized protein n=1 Tax=Stylosanthes scabra TaxID=79078 RepID=A0ABU6RAU3_9FABA|nr:hypothetical protein [Stylosanthes scabra]